ncbi:glycoside hydrolase family 97 protein [Gaoshiqia sp. Z1-71]|uniref:glycoside hydrolase family 97 protein n=1 Tax=Gaoshiqia hydrogeniformans TaxID=3290090 RepID=UPI003BF84F99
MKTSITCIFLLLFAASGFAQPLILKSPDGNLQVTIETGNQLRFSVSHGQTEVLAASPISMSLKNGTVWGINPKLKSNKAQSVNQTISASIYKKNEIQDVYNELILNFSGNYSVIFRAYDQGVAYRFTTTAKEEIFIQNEEVSLNFSHDKQALVPYVRDFDPQNFDRQFFNSFENTYTHLKISELNKDRLMFLPMVVALDDGKKLCFTEADLESYPGLYLINRTGNTSLTGVFAPYPKQTKQGGHNMLQQIVTERENYIAKLSGPRSFPWRVLAVSASDKELLNNDLVYLLAAPSRVPDISWIKPGKVAWDWWNDWNIYGVDFRAGINNETYKYYIDFAADHGIEYVILDEGWAVNKQADLLQIVPEIDVKELVGYGNAKNVGIILWAGYWAMDRDLENVCRTYADMGVKGFKVDFMDRDDQLMVDFYYRCAATAAKYKLMIDYHGAYKPTGLHRTYPNVINFEGVFGLEQLKWSPAEVDMVTYDVTMPYIRMLAGPLDYTQGAMRNASRHNYRPVNSEPMSQGTRCRQLAEYVIFESPFNMLCDNPSNYMNEPESTRFIAEIPTVWDKTIALDGKIGEYIAIARQKDGIWYVGGLTNWDKRELTVDLSFLDEGNYQLEIFRDGINADRAARDYKKEIVPLPANKKLGVTMMPGGGFAAKISKK